MARALSVVVVDDNPDDRVLTRRVLEKEFSPLDVKEVTTSEAFDRALAGGPPNLVVTDFHLGWTDGLTVVRAVKGRWPECPVVMLTGTGTEEIAVEAMKSGLDDYVLKSPKHRGRFAAAVRGVLERAESRRRTAVLERRLADLLDTLNVGTFRTADDGRLLEANPAVLRILGYPSFDEARDRNLAEIYPTPGDRAIFLKRLLATGAVHGHVLPLKRRDGTTFWASLTEIVRQGPDGVTVFEGTMEDVTARVQSEAALRASEERYRTVFHHSPIGIFHYDNRLRITDCNDRHVEIMQSSRDRLIGLDMYRLKDQSLLPALLKPLEGEEGRFVGLYHATTGPAVIWVSMRTAPLRDAAGTITGAVGIVSDITERKRVEAERDRLFNLSVDMMCVAGFDGYFKQLNPSWERTLGWSNDELMAKPYLEFVHADDRQPTIDAAAGLTRGEPALGFDNRYLCKDGSYRWISWSTYPLVEEGLMFGVARDVTERRRGEEERRHLVTAVEQAAEAIVITGTDGAIEYVNPAFTRTTGYNREETLGQNSRILKSGKQSAEFYRDLWSTLTRGEVWHGHFINKRKDGTLYDEDATISPVRDETGRVAHYVAVKRDISQEVALEEQLRQSQKLEAVGKLAGGVAHDFNNILQALMSLTAVLPAHQRDPERFASTVAELQEQVKRGAALTRQLLLFSRHEKVQPEKLDLNEVVAETTKMLRRLVRETIDFTVELSDSRCPVVADRGQLTQVLMNLVVNASDAMPEGGRLAVRTGQHGEADVFLEVTDSGHGIPEGVMPRIFEPFFTTKAAGKGTGLGLSVVHGIVAQHGGHIEVESAVGEGSRFVVVLPRGGSGPQPPVQAPLDRKHLSPESRGEKILVVEDEDGARRALSEVLKTLGYTVTAFGSAEEAVALPAISPFDLLLTDLTLPGISGGELAGILCSRWPKMRVVLMSGYTQDQAIIRGAGLGAVRFMQKPFDMAALARELRAVLDEPPTTLER